MIMRIYYCSDKKRWTLADSGTCGPIICLIPLPTFPKKKTVSVYKSEMVKMCCGR